MPIYIDIPTEYEDLLRELADNEDRHYRDEARHLLKWAITQRTKTLEGARERSLQEVAHAPAP